MRQKRSITFTLDSAVDDEGWKYFVKDLTGEAEQFACDYAADCEDDLYQLDTSTGEILPAVDTKTLNKAKKQAAKLLDGIL